MKTRAWLVAVAVLAVPAAVRAQDKRPPDLRGAYPDGPRGTVGFAGGGLALALPVGQFGNYVSVGGGFNGFAGVKLARDGAASIRLDGTFLIYGSETRHVPLSSTVQLVTVDVTTSNLIFNVGVGPQLTATRGAIRPYVNGEVGFSYFGTVSSVRGSHNMESFAESTNFDDFTFALRGGGGLWIQLARGRTPVALDLSAHYIRNGRVSYLREGSISFDLGGAPIYHPIESETNFWLAQIGVSLGLRPR